MVYAFKERAVGTWGWGRKVRSAFRTAARMPRAEVALLMPTRRDRNRPRVGWIVLFMVL